jgi:chaperonin cofactor prefoldin
MKQEEQTCIEDSPIYINVGWLLIANDKEELQILMLFFGAPF